MRTGCWYRPAPEYHQSSHQKIGFKMVVEVIQQKECLEALKYFSFQRMQQGLFKSIKHEESARSAIATRFFPFKSGSGMAIKSVH